MSNVFYSSAEIRWFLYDSQGQWDHLLNWFRLQDQLLLLEEGDYDPKNVTEPFVKRETVREDEYLPFPDSDTVGVKQRQGKFEIKALVAGPRPYALPAYAVVGRMDQWVKWSFASQLTGQLEAELSEAGPWQQVVKNRYLQKYVFDAGHIIAVSPDQRPDVGCNIELTQLTVKANAQTWLTFGFEAFGPPSHVIAILDEAVAHFFALHKRAPLELDGRDSLSYPAWLACLK